MPLKLLNFDCENLDCPSHTKRNCIPTGISKKDDNSTDDSVDVFIISDIPSTDDLKKKQPYTNRSAFITRRLMESLDNRCSYAFSKLIRCRPLDEAGTSVRSPSQDEIKMCQTHLKRDLADLKPKVLVVQGADVFSVLFPSVSSEQVVYNRVFPNLVYDGVAYTVILALSPRFIKEIPSSIGLLLEAVNKAADIVQHGSASMFHPDMWNVQPEIVYCDTLDKVKELREVLRKTKQKYCSLDVETKNLNKHYGNELTTVQFCLDPRDKAYVVPYQYMHGPFSTTEQLEPIKEILVDIFSSDDVGFSFWLTHSGKAEQTAVISQLLGVTFKNRPMIDTEFGVFCDDENRVTIRKQLSGSSLGSSNLQLKYLCREFCGRDAYDPKVLQARGEGVLYRLPPSDLIPYAAEDVIATQLVFRFLRSKWKSEGVLEKRMLLLQHLGGPTLRLVSKMGYDGFAVDTEHLKLLASPESPILKRMQDIKLEMKKFDTVKKANNLITDTFSGNQKPLFGSPWKYEIEKPNHNKTLVFDVLKMEPPEDGYSEVTGEPSLDKKFFELYVTKDTKELYPELHLIQEFVSMRKLATSYTANLMGFILPSTDPLVDNSDTSLDSRVRASFEFLSTVTGRLACHDPNIQQVPRADNLSKAMIKNMFAAQQSYGFWRPGLPVENVLMQLDFMAAEVRIAAILSGDTKLADALMRGKMIRDEYRRNPTPKLKKLAEIEGDIHKQTASLMFGVPVHEVTKDMRQKTKAIVFALLYGGGVNLIAARTNNKNIEEVKELCKKFYRTFPRMEQWLEWIEKHANENLGVESPIGRMRHLWEFVSDDNMAEASAKRYARNSPIQSFASDCCLIGAGQFNDFIEDNKKSWKIVNVVHDSCVTELPLADIGEAYSAAERSFSVGLMNHVKRIWGVKFIAPLEVEFEFGLRYGDMHSYDGTEENLDHITHFLSNGGLNIDPKTKSCPTCTH